MCWRLPCSIASPTRAAGSVLLALLVRSRGCGRRNDAACSQVAHDIPVDLVVVYQKMQEGGADWGGRSGLLVGHVLQRIRTVGERVLQCFADFGFLPQPDGLMLGRGYAFRF